MVTGSEVEPRGSTDAGTTFYHILVDTDGKLVIADGTTVVVTDGATGISQIKGSSDAGTTFYFVKVNASGELVVADGTTGVSRIHGTTDGGTSFVPFSAETYEGSNSIEVVPGKHHVDEIFMVKTAISAKVGLMLVDLSDTSNWPHTETGHIDIERLQISINPESNFRGTIYFGYLENVDADNGDLIIITAWAFTQKAATFNTSFIFSSGGHFHCVSDHRFGPTLTNDTTFQTDVNLEGPDNATSYPSGDGDLVMLVDRTAGTTDIAINIGYHTEA